MEYVKRKTMLYKTGVEYGDWCCNYVLGCSHGCDYCYAKGLKKRTGQIKSDDDWTNPRLVINCLDILKKELPKNANNIKNITLCFATDPFMFEKREIIETSIAVINLINQYGIICNILTKGLYPKKLEGIKRPELNCYGVSYVSQKPGYWQKFEPGAADPYERLKNLKEIKNQGFKTWISAEPWPSPEMPGETIDEFWDHVCFADYIIFGKGKYKKYFSHYDDFYKTEALKFKFLAEKYGKKFHIKEGTL